MFKKFGPFFLEEEEKVEKEDDSVIPSSETPAKNTSSNVVVTLSTIIVLLVIAILGGGYFYYLQTQVSPSAAQVAIISPQPSPLQLPLTDQVGKHIVLPNTENPTIATVADISKLSNQPFFLHAQNGDKVLLYPKAQVAYLYRPSIDKLIAVGPLTIESQPAKAPAAKAPQIPGNLEVLGAATMAASMKIEK